MIRLFVKILAVIGVTLALSLGIAGSATAAPPRDATYSYSNVTLVDSNGESGQYYIVGEVRYGGKSSPARTTCNYFVQPAPNDPPWNMTPAGQYTVPYVIADPSQSGVRQFCIDNFQSRTRP